MARKLVTGNYAAGHTLAMAGEANRDARGCCGGAYPITPQTEIIEFLRGFRFTKGRIVPVESEHSAMGVCIGASLGGARAFTASSSNGLAYMTENVFAAGYFRLPIVMVAVNRTLGPPWNIWVDQGDSLLLRDAAWTQVYIESHQDLVDAILLAFRVAEDPRVLLPALVCMDGFVISHTQMPVDLPEQNAVDRFLPSCRVPHCLSSDHPTTIGGLTWPRETARHRRGLEEAMRQVPAVMGEAIDEFAAIFGRRPRGPIVAEHTEDADIVLVTSATMTSAARRAVEARRGRGERVGLLQCRMFRPFPREALRRHLSSAGRIGVLDRNHSPGSGGIFWQEVCTALRDRPERVIQNYVVGLGGEDVTPQLIERILDDLAIRERAAEPAWEEADV